MAPLTRARADEHGVPSPLAAEYYAQRAGAGLIITEATAVSAQGTGYDELSGLVDQFRRAAERALGIRRGGGARREWLPARSVPPRRRQPARDAYGGSASNRARLLREVTEAVISVWSAERVGARISPLSPTNGMADSDPDTTFTQAARDLDALGVAYLHVIEPGVNGTLSTRAQVSSPPLASGFFRPVFSRTIIAAGGHTADTGTSRIQWDEADLIAYGQLFISNPDLPDRFRRHAALDPAARAAPSTAAEPQATPTIRPSGDQSRRPPGRPRTGAGRGRGRRRRRG